MAFTFSYYFNAFLNLKRAEIIKIRIRPNETLLLDVIPVLGKILFFELLLEPLLSNSENFLSLLVLVESIW